MATLPPSTITFAIRGPIARDDLPELYERACSLLATAGAGGDASAKARVGAGVVVCDVAGVAADAVSVDALARLQLAARRHRCRIEFRNASPDLRELIAFMGLDDVLPGWATGAAGGLGGGGA